MGMKIVRRKNNGYDKNRDQIEKFGLKIAKNEIKSKSTLDYMF